MAACCRAPCLPKSRCKSDSFMRLRGFTRIRPGTTLAGAPWRTQAQHANARTVAKTFRAVATVNGIRRFVSWAFFIALAGFFNKLVSSFPARHGIEPGAERQWEAFATVMP